MIAKTLVLVCAAFGIVAGSCIEFRAPQQCSSQLISVPVATEQSCFSGPVFSSGLSCSAPVMSSPCETSCSAPVFSSGLSCSAPVMSSPCETSCSAPVFSSGLSCSAPVMSTSVCSAPVMSAPVCSAPVMSAPIMSSSSPCESVCSAPVYSSVCGNSFSGNILSSCGSVAVQATNGPETSALPVVQAPSVTLPAVEGPIVTLSSQPIPAPRVLASKCICTKTIVKPQVYQRTVTVPKIQRYLKRTVTPVVENVAYKSRPIEQPRSCGSSSVVVSSGLGSGFVGASAPVVVSSGLGSGCVGASAPVVVSTGSCGQRFC